MQSYSQHHALHGAAPNLVHRELALRQKKFQCAMLDQRLVLQVCSV